MAAIIFLDSFVLTLMLYFTGGAHNPFTMLYLLHIALAVILLPSWAAWTAVTFCALCFAALFTSEHRLISDFTETCCTDMATHLKGMLIGMVVTGVGITFFVNQMNASLRAHHDALEKTRALREQHDRFASLATLAAGVAHELATPLPTIAVISKDLEQMSCAGGLSEVCRNDARSILQEVERCKSVLEKLVRQTEQPPGEPWSISTLPAALRATLSHRWRNDSKFIFKKRLPKSDFPRNAFCKPCPY